MWNSLSNLSNAAASFATPLKASLSDASSYVQESATKVLDSADSYAANIMGEDNDDDSGTGSEEDLFKDDGPNNPTAPNSTSTHHPQTPGMQPARTSFSPTADSDMPPRSLHDHGITVSSDSDTDDEGNSKNNGNQNTTAVAPQQYQQQPRTPKPASPARGMSAQQELQALRQEKSILQSLVEKKALEVSTVRQMHRKSQAKANATVEDLQSQLKASAAAVAAAAAAAATTDATTAPNQDHQRSIAALQDQVKELMEAVEEHEEREEALTQMLDANATNAVLVDDEEGAVQRNDAQAKLMEEWKGKETEHTNQLQAMKDRLNDNEAQLKHAIQARKQAETSVESLAAARLREWKASQLTELPSKQELQDAKAATDAMKALALKLEQSSVAQERAIKEERQAWHTKEQEYTTKFDTQLKEHEQLLHTTTTKHRQTMEDIEKKHMEDLAAVGKGSDASETALNALREELKKVSEQHEATTQANQVEQKRILVQEETNNSFLINLKKEHASQLHQANEKNTQLEVQLKKEQVDAAATMKQSHQEYVSTLKSKMKKMLVKLKKQEDAAKALQEQHQKEINTAGETSTAQMKALEVKMSTMEQEFAVALQEANKGDDEAVAAGLKREETLKKAKEDAAATMKQSHQEYVSTLKSKMKKLFVKLKKQEDAAKALQEQHQKEINTAGETSTAQMKALELKMSTMEQEFAVALQEANKGDDEAVAAGLKREEKLKKEHKEQQEQQQEQQQKQQQEQQEKHAQEQTVLEQQLATLTTTLKQQQEQQVQEQRKQQEQIDKYQQQCLEMETYIGDVRHQYKECHREVARLTKEQANMEHISKTVVDKFTQDKAAMEKQTKEVVAEMKRNMKEAEEQATVAAVANVEKEWMGKLAEVQNDMEALRASHQTAASDSAALVASATAATSAAVASAVAAAVDQKQQEQQLAVDTATQEGYRQGQDAAHQKAKEELTHSMDKATVAFQTELEESIAKTKDNTASEYTVQLQQLGTQLLEKDRCIADFESKLIDMESSEGTRTSKMEEELREQCTRVETLNGELQLLKENSIAQSHDLKKVRDKLRKTNAIALAHKRALDKEKQNLQVETSTFTLETEEMKKNCAQKIKQLQDDHAENVARIKETMEKTFETEKNSWQGSKEASQESQTLKNKSLVADAIGECQKEFSKQQETMKQKHLVELEQQQKKQQELLEQAVAAAVQNMIVNEQDRVKEREDEKVKEQEERKRLEALIVEHEKQQQMKHQHQHHHSMSETVVGRDGLEKRGTANSVMDLESGAASAVLYVEGEEESKRLLNGMTPPTPSKDKQIRPKPLVAAVKTALMGLPKRQRTLLVMYIAVVHVMLVLFVLF